MILRSPFSPVSHGDRFLGFSQAGQCETHIGFPVLLNDVQFHEWCSHPVGQSTGDQNVYGCSPDKVMLNDDFRSEESESDRKGRQFPQQGGIGRQTDKSGEEVKAFSRQPVDEDPAIFRYSLVGIIKRRVFVRIQVPIGFVGEPAFQ